MSQMVCFSVSLNASQFHLLIDGINVRQSGWCCNDPPGSGEQGHFHRHTKAPASVLNLSSPSVAIASWPSHTPDSSPSTMERRPETRSGRPHWPRTGPLHRHRSPPGDSEGQSTRTTDSNTEAPNSVPFSILKRWSAGRSIFQSEPTAASTSALSSLRLDHAVRHRHEETLLAKHTAESPWPQPRCRARGRACVAQARRRNSPEQRGKSCTSARMTAASLTRGSIPAERSTATRGPRWPLAASARS